MEKNIADNLKGLFRDEYNTELSDLPVGKAGKQIQLQATRPEFSGDITLVVFPLTALTKKSPEETANFVGEYLRDAIDEIDSYNVVKGFLNIVYKPSYWINYLNSIYTNTSFGKANSSSGKLYLVEYSSPNTNKPLHLGHLRNHFVGFSVAEILKANGHEVKKVQIINDRGIHICKSMLAWKKNGNGETPASSGLKGDKLVGKYYVQFDKTYKSEIEALIAQGKSKEEAEKTAPSIVEAQEMLLKWEAGDKEVIDLWKTMNSWVYEGFQQTYDKIKIDFDKNYYESNTYILGKDIVEDGLKKGVFYKKEDGSVWVDNTPEGLDEKILLRKDGTSVYMTQDIGTAVERYKDYPNVNGMFYTVGNEQDYHFKVLFIILKKLGYKWADELYHLSYGMVDLPTGKMKSREGTVVDADDIIDEMYDEAEKITNELGKADTLSEEEKKALFGKLSLGALKYFILKVDPKKRMLFNPAESIDFQGNTGPFIQYAYARINSLLEKAMPNGRQAGLQVGDFSKVVELKPEETAVIKWIDKFPAIVKEAGDKHSPAEIANYIYELVKHFNHFYQTTPVIKEEDEAKRNLRLAICVSTGNVIKSGLGMLGIEVPERM
jgi:arginyl-tRNA synthetase